MSDPGGGTQQPPLDNDEYAPDETALLPAANRLLRPRRSFVAPVVIFSVAFGVAASLTAIGIGRLDPIELRPSIQHEASAPQKRPDRFSEHPVEPAEPLKSLVLDAARSYMATMPKAKSGKI